MKYKRKKPRTKVRCTMCTNNRIVNSSKADRKADKVRKQIEREGKG
jgi:hypothetical protein